MFFDGRGDREGLVDVAGRASPKRPGSLVRSFRKTHWYPLPALVVMTLNPVIVSGGRPRVRAEDCAAAAAAGAASESFIKSLRRMLPSAVDYTRARGGIDWRKRAWTRCSTNRADSIGMNWPRGWRGWPPRGSTSAPVRGNTRGGWGRSTRAATILRAAVFRRNCSRPPAWKEYARTFPAVCGDFSFYQFPSEEFWARLFGAVPPEFRFFAFKVPEQITCKTFPQHERYGGFGGPKPRSTGRLRLLEECSCGSCSPIVRQWGR